MVTEEEVLLAAQALRLASKALREAQSKYNEALERSENLRIRWNAEQKERERAKD